MLDFVQSRKRKTGKSLSRVDFIQSGTWNLVENAEEASPDWTKSNEAKKFHVKAGFGWIKSNQDCDPCVIPLNPAYSPLSRMQLSKNDSSCRLRTHAADPVEPW